jgi:hypothetical protein
LGRARDLTFEFGLLNLKIGLEAFKIRALLTGLKFFNNYKSLLHKYTNFFHFFPANRALPNFSALPLIASSKRHLALLLYAGKVQDFIPVSKGNWGNNVLENYRRFLNLITAVINKV